MANDNPPPKVSSDIAGIRAPGNFQAVEATYYNLTDSDSRSVAGFLVLLDSMHRPVRAELYLYEESAGPMREQTLRQAQQILQGRYYSRQPVPLRVLDVQHESHSVDVALPDAPVTSRGSSYRNTGQSRSGGWQRWGLPVVGALLLLLLLGLSARWLIGRNAPETQVEAEAPATAVEAEDASPAAASDAAPPDAQFASDADLPPSVNADPSIQPGMRVQVDPRYRAFLLSRPDASDDNIIGELEPGTGMLVQDGPVLRQGESDTIVWWFVLTDAGAEGWVPANTSQVTVLQALP